MSSEAWESLPPEQRQQMHWLAARMTAHLMRMGLLTVESPSDVLANEVYKANSRLKPSRRSTGQQTARTSATASTATQGRGLHTALRPSASTTWTDVRLTSSLVVDEMPRATRLDNLYNKWRMDEEFKHLRMQANFVPGDGRWPAPDAILIGEAPGAEEDKHKRPFCGRSGNMLDGMLWDAGLTRPNCFITNVVKWRPPRNRTPTIDEVEYSIPYLRRELMVVAPDGGLVILLGAVALAVVDQDMKIGECHGRPFTRGNWTFVPLYHPAFILRQWSRRRDEYKSEWAKIKKLVAA